MSDNSIKNIKVYVYNVVLTTHKGLKNPSLRSTYKINQNVYFKINLYSYHGFSQKIWEEVRKLNDIMIKEFINKYYENADFLNEYTELFDYSYDTDPDFPDTHTIVDLSYV